MHVRAVQRLHALLRDCVSLMAVGLVLPRADTIAEDKAATASTKAAVKELGDVRYVAWEQLPDYLALSHEVGN